MMSEGYIYITNIAIDTNGLQLHEEENVCKIHAKNPLYELLLDVVDNLNLLLIYVILAVLKFISEFRNHATSQKSKRYHTSLR